MNTWLANRRWFRGKSRGLTDAAVEDTFDLDLAGEHVELVVIRCVYQDGGEERYVTLARGGAIENDALADPRLLSALMQKMCGARIAGAHGTLLFRPLPGFDDGEAARATPHPSTKEQTNTSIPFGEAYVLKIVRKLDEGRSAELEMGEYLTRHDYRSAPEVVGAIEIAHAGEQPSTVGIVHRYVPNQGDAWATTLEAIARDPRSESYAETARLLGRRVAEMHAVLAAGDEPGFAPVIIGRAARELLAMDVRSRAAALAKHLRPGDRERIDVRLSRFVEVEPPPLATRIHGDLHLGQILSTKGDFVIIDFEGEPARTLHERKAKRSPLADVAGMMRSFDYAAATANVERSWARETSEAFLAGYGFGDRGASREVLDFYVLEKCIYEIGYEANHRPDWIRIPLGGLFDLLGGERIARGKTLESRRMP